MIEHEIGMQFQGRNQSIAWDEIELLLLIQLGTCPEGRYFPIPNQLCSRFSRKLSYRFRIKLNNILPPNPTQMIFIRKIQFFPSPRNQINHSSNFFFFFLIFNAQLRKRNEHRIINVLNCLLRLIQKGAE